jgi:cyclopropane-fatty-acyl-phospholipid synthase
LTYILQEDLHLSSQWKVNGRHYSRTCEDWLRKMDAHKRELMPLFRETYGAEQAVTWWVRWRLFYLACSELFNYSNGEEWGVSHYLFQKPSPASPTPSAATHTTAA